MMMGSGRRCRRGSLGSSASEGCPRSPITFTEAEKDGVLPGEVLRSGTGAGTTCRPRRGAPEAERPPLPPLRFRKRPALRRHRCELWLFVLILGVTVPRASAIVTLDQVRRWFQRIATCFCLGVAMICAVAVYNYIWFSPEDDEEDPWDEYEEAWEAEEAARRNRTKMEKLRLQQEEYERQQKLKEQGLMKAMANGTNCTLVNELRTSMNQTVYLAFIENTTGMNVSHVNFTDPCPLNLTWLVGWAARTHYEDTEGPCANLVTDQRTCALKFVDQKCDFVQLDDAHDEKDEAADPAEEIDEEEAERREQEEEEANAKAAEDWDLCQTLPRFDLIERCGESVCNSVCSQIESCVPVDYYLYGCAKDCASICLGGDEAGFEGCFSDCAENTCPGEWELSPLELLKLLEKPGQESEQRVETADEGPRLRRLLSDPGSPGTAGARAGTPTKFRLHKGTRSDDHHAVALREEIHDLAAKMIIRGGEAPSSRNAREVAGLASLASGVLEVQEADSSTDDFSGPTTSQAFLRGGQPASFLAALLLLVPFWRSVPWMAPPLWCRGGGTSARRGRAQGRTA